MILILRVSPSTFFFGCKDSCAGCTARRSFPCARWRCSRNTYKLSGLSNVCGRIFRSVHVRQVHRQVCLGAVHMFTVSTGNSDSAQASNISSLTQDNNATPRQSAYLPTRATHGNPPQAHHNEHRCTSSFMIPCHTFLFWNCIHFYTCTIQKLFRLHARRPQRRCPRTVNAQVLKPSRAWRLRQARS